MCHFRWNRYTEVELIKEGYCVSTLNFFRFTKVIIYFQIDAYSICLFKTISTGFEIVWKYSIFFDHSQNVLNTVKSKFVPYKFVYLSMVKNIWTSRWNRHKNLKQSGLTEPEFLLHLKTNPDSCLFFIVNIQLCYSELWPIEMVWK